jgi:hypothetical protein
MPSLREAQTAALSDPLSMTTTAAVDQIQASPDQKIDPTTGQLTGTTPTIDASTATTATPVAAPTALTCFYNYP